MKITNNQSIYLNKLNNKTILITGGTGTIGKSIYNKIINNSKIKKIIIFSRDESKQLNFKKNLSAKNISKTRFFIGDVRDRNRLLIALQKVDIVIHAAALKQIDTAEYNPIECIKTNIDGAINVIECSFYNNVEKVVALSTDKASSPVNLYGATKLCSDKLFISANQYYNNNKTIFSVIRYGNVLGSRGSIVDLYLNKNKKILNLTDDKMTRFSITIEEASNFILNSMSNMIGGEIFIPKIPSYKILDLIAAMGYKNNIKIIGIRPGEKIHEEMISSTEILNTIELNDKFLIIPLFFDKKKYIKKYQKNIIQKKTIKESYSSNKNIDFLSINELKVKLSNLSLK